MTESNKQSIKHQQLFFQCIKGSSSKARFLSLLVRRRHTASWHISHGISQIFTWDLE